MSDFISIHMSDFISIRILPVTPACIFLPDVMIAENTAIFGRPDLQFNVLYERWL